MDELKSLSSVCTVTQEDDTSEEGVGWSTAEAVRYFGRKLADTSIFCQQKIMQPGGAAVTSWALRETQKLYLNFIFSKKTGF